MFKDNKKLTIIFIVSISLVVILSLLLIISRSFGNYDNISVRKNKKTIFSITDLTLNNLKFGDNEDTVIKELGEPKDAEIVENGIYEYKVLKYDGLTVTLKEDYDSYMLTKVEITSRKYKTSRRVKVGKSITSVIKKYKVDNTNGTYLYGNYETSALNNTEITDSIYLGVRSKNEVVYVYKDASVEGINPNIARLNISYKHGRVTKITWSYDFE